MRIRTRLRIALSTFAIALSAVAITAPTVASAAGTLTKQATFTSPTNGWAQVERWSDSSSYFTQESFPPDGRGNQGGQRSTFFGSTTPHSRLFLLFKAPGWDTNGGTPVLLVHGANQDADVAWADPNEHGSGGCGVSSCPSTGLMQQLSTAGLRVFAINFAHKQGDGYQWSEQVANAISVIKTQTGASKVDVVAWSKGGFNARMYPSGVKLSGGTAYRGDIRKLILVGAPNNGIDYSYRHGWTFTFAVYPACGGGANAPAPHDAIYCYYAWRYGSEWTDSSAYFPGQRQMLKRWDSTYGLPTYEQDWYTTYHGGWGYYSHSNGINASAAYSLVDTIRTAGVPSGVKTYLLCGDQNDVANLHNEHTGTSDGIVFKSSCNSTTGIGTVSGNVTAAVNHLELGWKTTSTNQIQSWLTAP